jgi:hypothetical protein
MQNAEWLDANPDAPLIRYSTFDIRRFQNHFLFLKYHHVAMVEMVMTPAATQ